MKETLIYKRLYESIGEIREDLKNGASKSFLARKHFVSRNTMIKFLKEVENADN